MVRLSSYDTNGMKKGAWCEEEDARLRTHIEQYGHRNWRLVPVYAGLARCGKSCRLRWVNYLKPGLRRGNFTQHEEDLIIELHALLGNKWSTIAARLRGRTDNEIKNHWHAHLRKRCSKRNVATSKANHLSQPNSCNSTVSDEYHQNEAAINPENTEPDISVNQQIVDPVWAGDIFHQTSSNQPITNVPEAAFPFSNPEFDELLMLTNNEYSYGSDYSSSYTGLTSMSTAESQPSFGANSFGMGDDCFDYGLWGQFEQPLYVDHYI